MRSITPSQEEQRYAKVLQWMASLGLAILVIGFFLYATGVLSPFFPIEKLPD
jgi:hypothetical protein